MPLTLENANGTTEDKRLFLLDAYALIYRAYFSFIRSPRVNSQRMNTSAAFGFTLTLLDLIKREKPTHIAVVFDTAAPTERHAVHTEYKANRQEMPDDIRSNVPYIRRIIEAFNIPVIESDGYEADDVIGTLAKKAEREGYTTYMVTPDKDFGQLVTDKILMYKPGRNGAPPELLGPKEVCERWDLENTDQVRDILGLMGDAVDNIPGIPGIGEKTAVKLVKQFGSLEGVLEGVEQLKGKQKENVIAFAEQGRMSKALATILVDAPVDVDHKALHLDPPDEEKIREVFSELEFRTLLKTVLGEEAQLDAVPAQQASRRKVTPKNQMDMFGADSSAKAEVEGTGSTDATSRPTAMDDLSTVAHDYRIASTAAEQLALAKELAGLKEFCFDTETDDLDVRKAELVGLSFSWKAHEGWYVPVPEGKERAQAVVNLFRAVLESGHITKVAQNLKYDMLVMERYDLSVQGPQFDTMLAHFLLESDLRHGMDYMAETLLHYRPRPITDLIGPKGRNQKSMRDVPVEIAAEYAAEDADITWQLYELLVPRLKEMEQEKLFHEVEMPLVRVLADMEREGIRLDVEALNAFSKELGDELIVLQDKIIAVSGVQFNIDSPKQLGDVLFETLKLGGEKPKKTKTGQYQTSEDVLSAMAHEHAVIPLILDYRSLRKLKGTYVDTLPLAVDPTDGRVHTNYRQAVAATGRLSSDEPNLQNIPIRTEKGREIRKAFVPRDEHYGLLSADYSQIELRIIAHMSGDANMQEAFRQGLDIHAATAAKVFNTPLDEVTREQRSRAKAVNFGIAYGQGAFGLSQNLGIPRAEAQGIITGYFAEFPGVKGYMDEMIGFCREHGYVQTLMGRRRYLPDITSGNNTVRAAAERVAINAPMQGTAADIIKVAMIRIHAWLKAERMNSKLLLQVHDELVFDCHLEEAEALQAQVKHLMEGALELAVPLVVDMRVGKNWLEAH
ncbi:MAG: DNA polymerase I [Flavobacteriales bacterium]|jgi:DNA polymerase-1|nr:DNA polymerase I [Flavobacteriales bacterium]MCB0757439.1 DNA polymerase I [Flavobacteriales bacterium]